MHLLAWLRWLNWFKIPIISVNDMHSGELLDIQWTFNCRWKKPCQKKIFSTLRLQRFCKVTLLFEWQEHFFSVKFLYNLQLLIECQSDKKFKSITDSKVERTWKWNLRMTFIKKKKVAFFGVFFLRCRWPSWKSGHVFRLRPANLQLMEWDRKGRPLIYTPATY